MNVEDYKIFYSNPSAIFETTSTLIKLKILNIEVKIKTATLMDHFSFSLVDWNILITCVTIDLLQHSHSTRLVNFFWSNQKMFRKFCNLINYYDRDTFKTNYWSNFIYFFDY